ncbi:MAG: hypothetical protein AAGI01_18155, partial [Myxococcota bacterium]
TLTLEGPEAAFTITETPRAQTTIIDGVEHVILLQGTTYDLDLSFKDLYSSSKIVPQWFNIWLELTDATDGALRWYESMSEVAWNFSAKPGGTHLQDYTGQLPVLDFHSRRVAAEPLEDGAVLDMNVRAEHPDHKRPLRFANELNIVWLSRNGDVDGDGLSNADELLLGGSDPFVDESALGIVSVTQRPAINSERTPFVVEFTNPIEVKPPTAPGAVFSVSHADYLDSSGLTTSIAGEFELMVQGGQTASKFGRWIPTGDIPLGQVFDFDLNAGALVAGTTDVPAAKAITLGPEVTFEITSLSSLRVTTHTGEALPVVLSTDELSWTMRMKLYDGQTSYGSLHRKTGFFSMKADGRMIPSYRHPISAASDTEGLTTIATGPLPEDGAIVEARIEVSRRGRVVHTGSRWRMVWLKADADFDGDGMTNAEEVEDYGTDPLSADSELLLGRVAFGQAINSERAPLLLRFNRPIVLGPQAVASDIVAVHRLHSTYCTTPGAAPELLTGEVRVKPGDAQVLEWTPNSPIQPGCMFSVALLADPVTLDSYVLDA